MLKVWMLLARKDEAKPHANESWIEQVIEGSKLLKFWPHPALCEEIHHQSHWEEV